MASNKENEMKEWILARLREPSTWKGLALLAGVAGVNVSPELLPQIGTAVGAAIGAVDLIRQER
jgi:hypothetical protein